MSIVGQYHVIGPRRRAERHAGASTRRRKVDLAANLRGPEGQKLSWRRLDANAEGLADLTTLAADGPGEAHLRLRPGHLADRAEGPARPRHPADVTAWLDGKPVDLVASRTTRELTSPARSTSSLPKGRPPLLIRVPAAAGGQARS